MTDYCECLTQSFTKQIELHMDNCYQCLKPMKWLEDLKASTKKVSDNIERELLMKMSGKLDPDIEFKPVILNLIRCLDAIGGLKEGDKISFSCKLTKAENDLYHVMGVKVTLNDKEL